MGYKEINMTEEERIMAVPPEDLAKYVIVCEVTETSGDKPSTSFMNLFAKTSEEAFMKVLTINNIIDKPNTTIKVMGTYVRTKLTVIDNV